MTYSPANIFVHVLVGEYGMNGTGWQLECASGDKLTTLSILRPGHPGHYSKEVLTTLSEDFLEV